MNENEMNDANDIIESEPVEQIATGQEEVLPQDVQTVIEPEQVVLQEENVQAATEPVQEALHNENPQVIIETEPVNTQETQAIPVQESVYASAPASAQEVSAPTPAYAQQQPGNPDTQPYNQQVYSQPQPQYVYPGANVGPGGGYAGQGYNQAPYSQPGVYVGNVAYNGPAYSQPGYTGPGFAPPPPLPPAPAPKVKKEKNPAKPMNLSAAALVSIIVICCVVSGVGGGLVGASINGGNDAEPVRSGDNIVNIEASSDITVTEAVAKKVLSSVVGITATGTIVTQDFFFGQQESEVIGVGTGMVLDTQGYILTNSHVVMDGTVGSIKVLMSTGDEVDGKVIWSDASLDLAIVKIEAENLTPVELGNSDEVAIGSYVAAIGNPLGLSFNGSITQGVVSGLDRTITVSDETGSNMITMEDLIQVDAAINSGNSGGPLLNSKGQVIGVNTAKAQAEGMGFAIPINTAVPIVEKVIRDGVFERVYMGISAADVAVIKANYPNVEILAETGAVITDVNPGSPAEKAGLKVKDVVISVDGKEIKGSSQLVKMLLSYESGDVIDIVYLRDGTESETKLTLVSATELNKIQEEENPFKNPPQEERQNPPSGGNPNNPFGW